MNNLVPIAAAAIAAASNNFLSVAIYITVGVLPCLLWLFFYLWQDKHPEPKKEIFIVFLLGGLSTLPAVFVELFLIKFFNGAALPALATTIITNIIGIGFIEEFFKYFAVWFKEQAVNRSSQLDEPVDFVIYMIVSALGFAAVENLLILFPLFQMDVAIYASLFRALSAILLHTLASGIVGYYLAMTFCDREHKLRYLVQGLALASFMHGLYNLSIIASEQNLDFLFCALGVLTVMAFMLYGMFKKLQSMKSVCNMKIK